MPDLKPDLSIFTKPQQQMGVGDMMNTVIGIQKYQGQQGISDLLKTNIDPITEDPDLGAVTSKLHTVPGMITPEQVTGLENAHQAQMATRTQQITNTIKVLQPLAAKPKLTMEEVQAARTQLAGIYGGDKRGAMIAEKILAGADTPAKVKERLINYGNAYGMPLGLEDVPGPGGLNVKKPSIQVQQEAVSGGPGGGGPAGGGPGPSSPPGGGGPGGGAPPQERVPRVGEAPETVPLGPSTNVANPKQQDDYNTMQQHEQNYGNEVGTLEKTITSLAKLGEHGTGQGSETVNNIKAFLGNYGIADVDGQKIVNYQLANKGMYQWLMNQGFAGHSVEHLIAAAGGNPNKDLQQQTNLTLLKMALAMRRMQQAGYQQFEGQGGSYPQWNAWKAKWAAKQDYVGYMWDTLKEEQQRAHVKEVGGPKSQGYRNLINSINTAQRFKLEKRDLDWQGEQP